MTTTEKRKKQTKEPLNIGGRLKYYREAAKQDVSDLAKSTGISVSGIRKMESSGSNPTVEFLRDYLSHCNVTLGQFFDEYHGSHPERRLHNMLRRLLESPIRDHFVGILETYYHTLEVDGKK